MTLFFSCSSLLCTFWFLDTWFTFSMSTVIIRRETLKYYWCLETQTSIWLWPQLSLWFWSFSPYYLLDLSCLCFKFSANWQLFNCQLTWKHTSPCLGAAFRKTEDPVWKRPTPFCGLRAWTWTEYKEKRGENTERLHSSLLPDLECSVTSYLTLLPSLPWWLPSSYELK